MGKSASQPLCLRPASLLGNSRSDLWLPSTTVVLSCCAPDLPRSGLLAPAGSQVEAAPLQWSGSSERREGAGMPATSQLALGEPVPSSGRGEGLSFKLCSQPSPERRSCRSCPRPGPSLGAPRAARWSCVAERGLALPTASVTPEMIRRPHLWTRLYLDGLPQSPADVSPGSQDLRGGALSRTGWGARRAPAPAPTRFHMGARAHLSAPTRAHACMARRPHHPHPHLRLASVPGSKDRWGSGGEAGAVWARACA